MRNFLAAISVIALCLFGTAAMAQTATSQVSVTPNASAYSTGNCLGTVQPVPQLVVTGSFGGTIIANIDITDSSGTNAPIDILFFSQKPVGTYTDKSACTLNAQDVQSFVGFTLNTSFASIKDAGTTAGAELAAPALAITLPTPGQGAQIVYALPIIRGSATYASGALTSTGQGGTASVTIPMASTTGYAVNQTCTDTTTPGIIPTGATIVSLIGNTSITLSVSTTGTGVVASDTITCKHTLFFNYKALPDTNN